MKFSASLSGIALLACSASAAGGAEGQVSIERGAYIAATSGCHDCHTGGFAQSGGMVDPAAALAGVPVGFRGPWGTSYPANLRLYMTSLSEDEWVAKARALRTLPPMPWFAVNMMEEGDLRSLYQYVKSLGAVGGAMPPAVAPGEMPTTPVIDFVPHDPAS